MDIREYSYVLAYVDCGSMSKAAEKLFISQPALSLYIKNLEARLGFTFYEKVGSKRNLTQQGALYVDYARQIMNLNHNLYSQLEDFHNLKRGMVRIGITSSRAATVLPRLLPAFTKDLPSIQVEVYEGTSKELEEKILMQELDFVILNYPFKNEGLEYMELYDQEIVLAVHKGNPLCEKAVDIPDSPYKWIDMHETQNEPFVLLHRGRRMRQIADSLFAEAGVNPRIIYETASAFTAQKLTEANMGSSFTTDSFCKTYSNGGVAWFSIGKPRLLSKLVIVYKPDRKLSRAAKATIDVVNKVLKSPSL